MQLRLILIFAFMLSILASCKETEVEWEENWLYCEETKKDPFPCATVRGICDWAAANKKYKNNMLRYYNQQRETTDCKDVGFSIPSRATECVENKCQLFGYNK